MKTKVLISFITLLIIYFYCLPFKTSAQTEPGLHGKVVDENGKPLPNVSVTYMSNDKKKLVLTNNNGEFNFQNNYGNGDRLVVSFIGYNTIDTSLVSGQPESSLIIKLFQSDNDLDDAVVIGYGATSKRFNTGSIGLITSKDIESQPVANVLSALQGRIAGLDIVAQNNSASGQFNIGIRGAKDLLGNGSAAVPLIIVDGVPLATSNGNDMGLGLNQNNFPGANGGQSPLYSLNPNDIESIEVLRDADATSIYGARAANGVILITTKKNYGNKPQLDINFYTGILSRPPKVKLLNTKQYVEMREEALANDGTELDENNAPDLFLWDTTKYTDWQRQLANSSITNDGQIYYSAGDQYNSFRLSGGIHRQTPGVPSWAPKNFYDERYSGSVALTHKSKDQRLELTLKADYSFTQNVLPAGNWYEYLTPPNSSNILTPEGKFVYQENWTLDEFQDYYNKFASLYQPYSSNTKNLIASLNINYKILNNLLFAANLGYTTTDMNSLQKQPSRTVWYPASDYPNQSSFGTNNYNGWVIEPNLTYNNKIGNGILTAMVGATLQSNTTKGTFENAQGFTSEALMNDKASASTITEYPGVDRLYRYQGYFTRLGYNLYNKYIINLTGRRDASSRFRPEDQWGSFGSASIAWIFTEEKFTKSFSSVLSFGKLRASYGSTGSNVSQDYAYYSVYGSPVIPSQYNGNNPLQLLRPYNPGYTWQVNKKLEIGLDTKWLKDRISMEVEFYNERIGNQLINYPLPGFTGFNSVIANLPALVQNRGWEFTLHTVNIQSKNLSWNTDITFSSNKNKLLSFPGLANSSYYDTYIVGTPITVQKQLIYTGVDPETGTYTFKDMNGNGTIDIAASPGQPSDRIPTYNAAPVFFGGIGNNVQFKNWALSFFFDYKKQKGPYSLSKGIPGFIGNQPVAVLKRWQKPGDITDIHKFTQTDAPDIDNYSYSNANVMNASYLRLNNISLSYSIPVKWAKSMKMQSLRIYFQAENVCVISGFKGNDPTLQLSNTFQLPQPKVFTGGINFKF